MRIGGLSVSAGGSGGCYAGWGWTRLDDMAIVVARCERREDEVTYLLHLFTAGGIGIKCVNATSALAPQCLEVYHEVRGIHIHPLSTAQGPARPPHSIMSEIRLSS